MSDRITGLQRTWGGGGSGRGRVGAVVRLGWVSRGRGDQSFDVRVLFKHNNRNDGQTASKMNQVAMILS